MKDLNQKQLDFLKNHKSIERITAKHVVFSFDFKLRVVKGYLKGISALEIFRAEGFDFLPRKMITNSVLRWRDKYKLNGENGLKESPRGRQAIHKKDSLGLSYNELLVKVEYLEQENNFLKKLKALREE